MRRTISRSIYASGHSVLGNAAATRQRLLTGTFRVPYFAAFLLIAVIAACDSDKVTSAEPTSRTVEGTYILKVYNTQPLPHFEYWDGNKRELLSGSLVLRRDNTYSETMINRDSLVDGTVQTINLGTSGTFNVRTEYRGDGSYTPGSYGYDTTIYMTQGPFLDMVGVVRGSSINIRLGRPGVVFAK